MPTKRTSRFGAFPAKRIAAKLRLAHFLCRERQYPTISYQRLRAGYAPDIITNITGYHAEFWLYGQVLETIRVQRFLHHNLTLCCIHFLHH
jgi:hypothetical protein